jgi:hypothetical protein
LAFLGEAQLALIADGVALLATLRAKQVLSQLSLALSAGDHLVQSGGGGLAPGHA